MFRPMKPILKQLRAEKIPVTSRTIGEVILELWVQRDLLTVSCYKALIPGAYTVHLNFKIIAALETNK